MVLLPAANPKRPFIGKRLVIVENQESYFLAISMTSQSNATIFSRNFPAWVSATAAKVATHICVSHISSFHWLSIQQLQTKSTCHAFVSSIPRLSKSAIKDHKLFLWNRFIRRSAIATQTNVSGLRFFFIEAFKVNNAKFTSSFFEVASLGDQQLPLEPACHAFVFFLSKLWRSTIQNYKLFLRGRFARRSATATQISVSCFVFFWSRFLRSAVQIYKLSHRNRVARRSTTAFNSASHSFVFLIWIFLGMVHPNGWVIRTKPAQIAHG